MNIKTYERLTVLFDKGFSDTDKVKFYIDNWGDMQKNITVELLKNIEAIVNPKCRLIAFNKDLISKSFDIVRAHVKRNKFKTESSECSFKYKKDDIIKLIEESNKRIFRQLENIHTFRNNLGRTENVLYFLNDTTNYNKDIFECIESLEFCLNNI